MNGAIVVQVCVHFAVPSPTLLPLVPLLPNRSLNKSLFCPSTFCQFLGCSYPRTLWCPFLSGTRWSSSVPGTCWSPDLPGTCWSPSLSGVFCSLHASYSEAASLERPFLASVLLCPVPVTSHLIALFYFLPGICFCWFHRLLACVPVCPLHEDYTPWRQDPCSLLGDSSAVPYNSDLQ